MKLRAPTKRFTRARACDTPGCTGRASYLEKRAPGRGGRVQLCWPCALRLGKVR